MKDTPSNKEQIATQKRLAEASPLEEVSKKLDEFFQSLGSAPMQKIEPEKLENNEIRLQVNFIPAKRQPKK